MQSTRSILRALVAAVAVCAPSSISRADHLFCGTDSPGHGISWSGVSTTLTVGATGWPQGTPWFGDALTEIQAQNNWSNFDFTVATSDGSWQPGRNDMIFVNGPNATFPNALAVTNRFYEAVCGSINPPCCVGGSTPSHIVEADIVVYINNAAGNINWVSGAPAHLVNVTDFNRTVSLDRTVLSHEMLHAVGLEHSTSNFAQARMSPNDPSSGWFDDGAIEPLGFDVGDLQALYGGTTSGVGAMYANNLQAVAPAGAMAPLSWDPSTNNSDVFPRNKTPIAGQPTNRVRRGQSMEFRWCVGNRASTSQAVPMRLFLSTDATLNESADIAVGTINFSAWAARSSQCGQTTFSIPNTVPNGTFNLFYRMGAATDLNPNARTAIINRQIVVIP